jgi:hypothetical protein
MKLLLAISIILVIAGCGLILVNFVFPHMVSVREAVQVPYTAQVPVYADMGGESDYSFLQHAMGTGISNTPAPQPSVQQYQAQSILGQRETQVTGYTNETLYRTELVPTEANSNLYLYLGSCVIGVGVVLIIVENVLFKRGNKPYNSKSI